MAQQDGKAWIERMERERAAAAEILASDDVFAPTTPGVSDLNIFTADLLAGPDPDYDPFLKAEQPSLPAASPPAEPA